MTQITTIPALLAMLRDTLRMGLDTITLHHNEVHLLLTEIERLDKETERLLNELREANTVYTNMAEDEENVEWSNYQFCDNDWVTAIDDFTATARNRDGSSEQVLIPEGTTGKVVCAYEDNHTALVAWDEPINRSLTVSVQYLEEG